VLGSILLGDIILPSLIKTGLLVFEGDIGRVALIKTIALFGDHKYNVLYSP
jgi:hypothetical protein